MAGLFSELSRGEFSVEDVQVAYSRATETLLWLSQFWNINIAQGISLWELYKMELLETAKSKRCLSPAAQYFSSSGMSLTDRFAVYQRRAAEKEIMKARKSPEIHR